MSNRSYSDLLLTASISCQLSFCPSNPNYLAGSTEKGRGHFSISLWDVEKASFAVSPNAKLSDADWSASLPRISVKPTPGGDADPLRSYQYGQLVTALSFLPTTQPYLLAAGVETHHMTIIDIRDHLDPPGLSKKDASSTIKHPPAHGICYDPFDDCRLATYDEEGFVRIWDRRRLEKPLMIFSGVDVSGEPSRKNAGLIQMEFSNVRRGTLATLGKFSSTVRYWSIVDYGNTSYSRDPLNREEASALPRTDITRYPSDLRRPHTEDVPSLTHTRRGKYGVYFIISAVLNDS